MKTVSIIVPVYNTGSYLHRCINSILSQTLKNIEVIIVDDGSNNDTAKICDEIAASDSRIRLVHKKNEGVSVARNIGLELSRGEYVGFVDSDDWVDNAMFEILVNELEKHNADVVMCDSTTVWDNGNTENDTFICLPESCTLAKNEIIPERLLEVAGSSCRALYKNQLLNGVKFPEGVKLSEDRIFNMIALGKSKRFRYIKKTFYNRYMRKGSCVMSYHPDFTNITLCVNDIMNDVLLKYWNESYISVFEKRNMRSIGYNAVSIFNLNDLDVHEKLIAIKAICYNKQLQEILNKYPVTTRILEYVRNKNLFGLYLLSIVEKIKSIVKSIRNI